MRGGAWIIGAQAPSQGFLQGRDRRVREADRPGRGRRGPALAVKAEEGALACGDHGRTGSPLQSPEGTGPANVLTSAQRGPGRVSHLQNRKK